MLRCDSNDMRLRAACPASVLALSLVRMPGSSAAVHCWAVSAVTGL
jgi:hypothetical protein